jgi:hypothetical protein
MCVGVLLKERKTQGRTKFLLTLGRGGCPAQGRKKKKRRGRRRKKEHHSNNSKTNSGFTWKQEKLGYSQIRNGG